MFSTNFPGATHSSALSSFFLQALPQLNQQESSSPLRHNGNYQGCQGQSSQQLSPDLSEALRLQEQRLEQALRLHGSDPRSLGFSLSTQQQNQQPWNFSYYWTHNSHINIYVLTFIDVVWREYKVFQFFVYSENMCQMWTFCVYGFCLFVVLAFFAFSKNSWLSHIFYYIKYTLKVYTINNFIK